LPFGKFGDITTSSRYINAEKTLKEHPNIKLAVGDSLGGSVALELQKHHPELQTRTCGAPVVDITGAINPPWKPDPTVQRYRNAGDPISVFGSKAHTTYYGKFYDKSTLTHQYDNTPKQLNLNNNVCIKHSSFMITILSFMRRISKTRRKKKKENQIQTARITILSED
ncbi:MAG: hypothetical protein ACKPKO_56175, partial [Candidatus Fonsibacter sp.]